MYLRFHIFGLKDNSGCTTTALHIARYFAGGGYNVALSEPANIKSPCLRDYTDSDAVPYTKEGIDIYPTYADPIPDNYDFEVIDHGTLELENAIRLIKDEPKTKYFCCSDTDEASLVLLKEFFSCQALLYSDIYTFLKECGEIKVNAVKEFRDSKVYKLSYSKTTCPKELINLLTMFCNRCNILTPDINYDLTEWVTSTFMPQKSFFGKKKKSEKPAITESSDDIETIIYDNDGLPIPSWVEQPDVVDEKQNEQIRESGIKQHQRDPDLISKPDIIVSEPTAAKPGLFKSLANKLAQPKTKPPKEPKNEQKKKKFHLFESQTDEQYDVTEVVTTAIQTFAEQEPATKSKLQITGHLSIFVTALRHSVGCTYVAGSLASTLANAQTKVCLVHNLKTEWPKVPNVIEYTGNDYAAPFENNKIVIFDKGCLGEFAREAMVELQRADIKILVCGNTEDDIKKLARHIHKCEGSAGTWLYVFNLVPGKKKQNYIKELMQDYNILFLESHDYEEVPKEVASEWLKQIKKKIK